MFPDAGGFLLTRNAEVARPYGVPTYWTHSMQPTGQWTNMPMPSPLWRTCRVVPVPIYRLPFSNGLRVLASVATTEMARQVWHHALAITYSLAWLEEAAEAIRQSWPRIPLPSDSATLVLSVLGERVAGLLDLDTEIMGVTTGKPRQVGAIAVPATNKGAVRIGCWSGGETGQ